MLDPKGSALLRRMRDDDAFRMQALAQPDDNALVSFLGRHGLDFTVDELFGCAQDPIDGDELMDDALAGIVGGAGVATYMGPTSAIDALASSFRLGA